MIFYNRREALAQNALKSMDIKDRIGREQKSSKEPTKLAQRVAGTETILGCMQITVGSQVRAGIQVQCSLYKLLYNTISFI